MASDAAASDAARGSRGDGDDGDKAADGGGAAEAYEATHVHAVYEAIAPHFSATRHTPWPLVADFVRAQLAGSVGLDVGCGNGKYLAVNRGVHLLGADRSAALVRLARASASALASLSTSAAAASSDADTDADAAPSPPQVVVADGLALPFRAAAADFVVCVAVVHHLSTRPRRRQAIAALLRCLRPDPAARALVYVWALEQAGSRRGWHRGSRQDTLVPWVARRPAATYQRYYHLYREGELDDDVRAAGGVVLQSGYERDNWWVVCRRSSQTSDDAQEPRR